MSGLLLALLGLGRLVAFTQAAKPYDAEVEWLESSGTQYIDTGIVPTNNHSLEVKFIYVKAQTNHFLAGLVDNKTQRFEALHRQDGKVETGFSNNYFITNYSPHDLDEVDIVIGKNWKVNEFSGVYNSIIANWNTTLWIFGANNTYGGNYVNLTSQRMLFSKVKNNTDLVLDLIPVRFTNENGVSEGAMYNRLGVGGMNPDGSLRTDGIFRNRGTGAFGWKDKNGVIVQPQ